MSQNNKDKSKETSAITISTTVIGVFILFVIIASAIILWSGDWQSKAQFGDSFGVINAFFSALAFAVIIYTLHLQQRDLHLTIEELKATRLHHEEHNHTVTLQRFENTFFNMVKLLQDHISNSKSGDNEGMKVYAHLPNAYINRTWGKTTKILVSNLSEIISQTIQIIALQQFGESDNDPIELQKSLMIKQRYINILSSVLTHDLIACYAINCMKNDMYQDKVFIERFGLLHKLPNRYFDLLRRESDFKDSAFDVLPII